MIQTYYCPTCGDKINSNRIHDTVAICQCGWMGSSVYNKIESKQERSICVGMTLAATLFVGIAIFIIQWDKYSSEILIQNARSLIGESRPVDFQKRSEICTLRKNIQCSVDSLSQLLKLKPNDTNVLGQLAKNQSLLGQTNDASKNYEKYFKLGGREHHLVYDYAKILASLGQIEHSKKYFEFALSLKPELLQVNVVRTYLSVLIKNGRYKDAKNIIYRTRKTGANAAYSFEYQLQQIKQATTRSTKS